MVLPTFDMKFSLRNDFLDPLKFTVNRCVADRVNVSIPLDVLLMSKEDKYFQPDPKLEELDAQLEAAYLVAELLRRIKESLIERKDCDFEDVYDDADGYDDEMPPLCEATEEDILKAKALCPDIIKLV
jgi:hypothetical protein